MPLEGLEAVETAVDYTLLLETLIDNQGYILIMISFLSALVLVLLFSQCFR